MSSSRNLLNNFPQQNVQIRGTVNRMLSQETAEAKQEERAPEIKRGQIKEADKSAKQTNSPRRASRGAT